MAVKKPVSKSLRLSDDVYALIDGYEGNNFSEKLENIVRYCYTVIPEREKKLAWLDQAVKRRADQCNRYWHFEDELHEISKLAASCAENMEQLRRDYDHLWETIQEDIAVTTKYIADSGGAQQD